MEIKEKIIELRKEGYYAKEILEILQVDYPKVLEEQKRIIEQGLLTEEDINEGKKKRRRRKLTIFCAINKLIK